MELDPHTKNKAQTEKLRGIISVRAESTPLGKKKISKTIPSGIELATLRLLPQCLNQMRYHVHARTLVLTEYY